MIKQVFVPYWEWEDWYNGMWRKLTKENEQYYLDMAIKFTGNHIEYGNAMGEVIVIWPRTMLNSLTNSSINKRAFLGHCACCYKLNIPEYITRKAWSHLTDKQRYLADLIAQKHIDSWLLNYENKNKTICKNMGGQMLFPWYT